MLEKMAKRTGTRRSFGGTTTPTSRFQFDHRNYWPRFEQENVPFDKNTLVNGPYRPKERLIDRDRVTQLLDDDEDSLGDDGLRSPLRGSSMYNQCDYPSLDNHSVHHETYRGGERGDQTLVSMLQHQQAMLQKLISQQESISEKQKAMDQRILSIEVKLAQDSTSMESSPGSSGSGGKHARVTRDLTNLVSSLHNSLDDGFHANESSTSEHNSKVKITIIQKITENPTSKYDALQVKSAVKRKYENMRREWVHDGKDDKDELTFQEALRKKYRARRQRKFYNRMSVVKPTEMIHWKQLALEYMTEESDDPDDGNVIIEHKLQWRSQKLEDFIRILDQRHEAKAKKDKGMMAKKIRNVGTPSCAPPPSNAPAWTVKRTDDGEGGLSNNSVTLQCPN